MSMRDNFVLTASYNRWMNEKLYDAAGRLSAAELSADKGAFFGSLFGTLNHLCVGDRVWLKRFSTQHPTPFASLDPIRELPTPTSLHQMLFDDFSDMQKHRVWLDDIIMQWIETINEDDLQQAVSYTNTKGIASTKNFAYLLMHFFNHQTHHRGQATTLLSQAGIDIGTTDLLALIPNES